MLHIIGFGGKLLLKITKPFIEIVCNSRELLVLTLLLQSHKFHFVLIHVELLSLLLRV